MLLKYSLFIILFFFQPFYFDQLINQYFKFVIFINLLFLYYFSINSKKTKYLIFLIFSSFILILSEQLLNSFYNEDLYKLIYLIFFIILGYLVSIIQNISDHKLINLCVIIYSKIFFVFCILNLINFISPYIINSPLQFNFGDKPYIQTFFGLVLPRNFMGLNFNYYFSYFYEPIYAGIFFYLNAFHLNKLLKSNNKNSFFIINILSGILTFSSTFYFLLFLEILKKINFKKYYFNFKIIFLYLITFIIIFNNNFLKNILFNSLSDRILRIEETVNFLLSQNLTGILLGNGYNYSTNLNKAPSNGYLFLLYEVGLIGFVFFLISFFKIFKKNILFLFLLLLLLEPIYRFPLLLFIMSFISNMNHTYEK